MWEVVRHKANVVGHSNTLKKRIRNGVEVDEEVIRIYVSKKVPLTLLKLGDIVPSEIEGVSTDIVEIGTPTSPPPTNRGLIRPKNLSLTNRIRPLVAGVSIGNWSITAGTLGWFFRDGKGKEVLGSNAHVFSENPLVAKSEEKRIVQPGRYDGGTTEDIVAEYLWHEPLGGSECTPSNLIAGALNLVYKGLGRKTRYILELNELHTIDFGVAVPSVDFLPEIYGVESFDRFVGLGFAGSDRASFFCKGTNILAAGWSPIDKVIQVAHAGDIIHKVGRTTGYTSGMILDSSVHIEVAYSDYISVELDDIIYTEKMIEGGDSGDSAWGIMTLES